MNYTRSFHGIKIIENPFMPKDIQKIKLKDSFKWCSDDFRQKQNLYLEKMFGVEPYFLMTTDSVISNPFNIDMLKRKLREV